MCHSFVLPGLTNASLISLNQVLVSSHTAWVYMYKANMFHLHSNYRKEAIAEFDCLFLFVYMSHRR